MLGFKFFFYTCSLLLFEKIGIFEGTRKTQIHLFCKSTKDITSKSLTDSVK